MMPSGVARLIVMVVPLLKVTVTPERLNFSSDDMTGTIGANVGEEEDAGEGETTP